MKKLKLYLLILFALAFALSNRAESQCVVVCDHGISVTPSNPTTLDNVAIQISGFFSDGCWEPAVLDSQLIIGNTVYVYSHANDNWQPGGFCILVIVDYQFTVPIGLLPAGNYTVISTLTQNSLRCPVEQACQSGFTVTQACTAKPGDINGDGIISQSDLVALVGPVFRKLPVPDPVCRADVNGDGEIDKADFFYLISYLFRGGPEPVKSWECCL